MGYKDMESICAEQGERRRHRLLSRGIVMGVQYGHHGQSRGGNTRKVCKQLLNF